jgi:hypothetical protein
MDAARAHHLGTKAMGFVETEGQEALPALVDVSSVYGVGVPGAVPWGKITRGWPVGRSPAVGSQRRMSLP